MEDDEIGPCVEAQKHAALLGLSDSHRFGERLSVETDAVLPARRSLAMLLSGARPAAFAFACLAALVLAISCIAGNASHSSLSAEPSAAGELAETYCAVFPSEYCSNHHHSRQFHTADFQTCREACIRDQLCTSGYFFDGDSKCYLFGVVRAQDKLCIKKRANPDVTRFDCSQIGAKVAPTVMPTDSPVIQDAPAVPDIKDVPAVPDQNAWDMCVGMAEVTNVGSVSIVSAKYNTPKDLAGKVEVRGGGIVSTFMKGRAYFADTCHGNDIANVQYTSLNLLGKTFRYNTDIAGAECGCNAALYLTAMAHNPKKGECMDHYCDAANVCGATCDEIDLQEANKHAWYTTVHSWDDPDGIGVGYGAYREEWNSTVYGPGARCIDTTMPFTVMVSFPVGPDGMLKSIDAMLEQPYKPCVLKSSVREYNGMAELTKMLKKGVTPIMSYWGVGEDMTWMDGVVNGTGPACKEVPQTCGETAKFWGFAVD